MPGTGLVLEGGGMRGAYTTGVLDFFLKNDINFSYIAGVSAGACQAVSYIAGQYGRGYRTYAGFADKKQYLSISNLLKTGSVFGMEYIFNEIPKKLDRFDYDAFFASPVRFAVGTADCLTGRPVYYYKDELDSDLTPLRASSSLPVVSRIVNFRGRQLLDGGLVDPIPFEQSIRDGNDRHVLVLTRERGYIKKPPYGMNPIYRAKYRNFPMIDEALKSRHELYNKQLREIAEMEADGSTVVIAPSRRLHVGRMEKNVETLTALYLLGFEDAKKAAPAVQRLLSAPDACDNT